MSNASQLLVGGDDVNAVVIDYGSSSVRYGHAGEDTPTLVLPTTIGVMDEIAKATEAMEVDDVPRDKTIRDGNAENINGNLSMPEPASPAKKTRQYIIDPNALTNPRDGLDIESDLMVDGMIDNFDAFEAIMEYALRKHRPIDPTQHPLLFSEPLWITSKKRELICEMVFEKFKASAFFTIKSPVLTCFAHGKSTGLVLDSGKIHTSAVAVHEGFCLGPTHVRSPLAGDFITGECRRELEKLKIDLTPRYLIKSKEAVDMDQQSKFLRKSNVPKASSAFHELKVREVIEDFKQILTVSDTPLVDVNKDSIDPREHEFPTGFHSLFGVERYQIPEYLFDPTQIRGAAPPPSSTLGASNLLQNCLSITDPDIRPQLWGNIIVSGGNSCMHGFLERVSADCTRRSTSSLKLKCVVTTGGPERATERLFAPWTGGSILGSLGTFQNMWISRNDYEETGKIVVAKKCP